MANHVRETTIAAVFTASGLEDLQRANAALDEIGNVAGAAGKEVDKFGDAAGIAKKEFDKFGDAAKDMGQEIDAILSNTEKTTKSKMMSIANVYKKNGMETSDAIKRAYEQYGDAAKQSAKQSENLGDSIGESSKEGIGGISGLTASADALSTALAGAAAAFSIGTLLQNVAEAQQALNTLQAQTGAAAAEMESMSESVKDLYTSGLGESMGEVADTTALVHQQFQNLDDGTLETITQNAMVMADTFHVDVNETLRGVNALMVNMGLTAEQAFDYIAAGTQNGLDKSGELSDNIAEYSQLWAQAGFSAEEMFAILQNGLDSGAYNLDKVNDFVKEFTISLSDGRMEENLDSFSDHTQDLFEQWRNGAASQKDVFESVIADLSSMTSEQEALTLASTTWSALGEDNAMQVITSLNQVNTAYQDIEGTMASINDIRYDDIGSSLEKVGRSAKSLLTETLTPAVSALSDVISTGLDGITNFAEENEALASGMSTAATTAGVLATGLIAVSSAIKIVKTALSGLSLSGGYVALAIGGIAALAGVAAGLAAAMNADEVEAYDGTLEECRNEIEQTEVALRELEDAGQGSSAAADDLRRKIEKLNAQYNKGGGYITEMQERMDDAAQAVRDLSEELDESYAALQDTETNGYNAAAMLQHFSEKAEKSNSDLQMMQEYADYLNDTFNMDIVVTTSGDVENFDFSTIIDDINAQIAENEHQIAFDALSAPELRDSFLAQTEQAAELQQQIAYAEDQLASYYQMQEAGDIEGMRNWEENMASIYEGMSVRNAPSMEHYVSQLEDEYEQVNADIAVTTAEIEEQGEKAGMTADAVDDLQESWLSASESLQTMSDTGEESVDIYEEIAAGQSEAKKSAEKYTDKILELAEAYDEAYQAAYDSFSGQFGLFDEASTESETYMKYTVENAQKALESQLAYWENYSANIDAIQSVSAEKLGVTQENYDAFIAYLQNGSEEAVALSDSIADNFANGNYDIVAEVINTNAEVSDMHSELAENTADWQTGLDEAMGGTISQMESSVNELDLSDAAAKSATNTMTAYTNAIRMAKQGAVLEAQSMVSSVQAVFDNAGLSYTVNGDAGVTATVPANASGTTNASDVFIAGEEGAELVVGMGGSTVFPASETEKIIDAVAEYADFSGGYTPESSVSSSYHSQTVTYAPVFQLTLNGGTSGMNQKQVKRWMQSAMDEVFASVMRTNPPVYAI